jgi:hypothetical protein
MKPFYIELVGCNDLHLDFYLPLGKEQYYCDRCKVIRQTKKVRVATQQDVVKTIENLGGIKMSTEHDRLINPHMERIGEK